MIKDYIVIGAGLSGINIALKIKEFSLGSLLVLEKSRGVGGRMATRRTLNTKFDHGAQFYKVKPDISDLHYLWKDKGISHQWFVSVKGNHWCSKLGMTSLVKEMSENIDIVLEKEIHMILFENNMWKLISDKGEEWLCKNLIISSPLPQTVKLLEKVDENIILCKSALSEIAKISYTKALVGLVTLEEDILFDSTGYQEFESGDIFSIADQKKKGLSEISALTLTMSSEFSEEEFDNSEEIVVKKIVETLISLFPNVKIKGIELKKWRYCKPTSHYKNLFLEFSPKLFLIGDAFGGASLLGALRSSNALCKLLINNQVEN